MEKIMARAASGGVKSSTYPEARDAPADGDDSDMEALRRSVAKQATTTRSLIEDSKLLLLRMQEHCSGLRRLMRGPDEP